MNSPQSTHQHSLQDDDQDPPRPTAAGGRISKKATGARSWLVLDSTGQSQVVEAPKQDIMRRTGLPGRDLRILDPLLSYPSTILGRDRAIVINLEYIKAIITAKEVVLLNSTDPYVVSFVEELLRRILLHYQATKAQDGNGEDPNGKNLNDSEKAESRASLPPDFGKGISQCEEINEEFKADGKQGLENQDGSKLFEFVALEACLESVCSYLDNEAKTLEQVTPQALDRLTSKISTLNLEHVRQIKSRLVAITKRVAKVRDELEHLLDDDEDMAEMYLTQKLNQQLEHCSASSPNEKDRGIDDEVLRENMDNRTTAEISLEATEGSTSYVVDCPQKTDNAMYNLSAAHKVLDRANTTKQLDMEELEMLLFAYFVQIDGALNRLSTLNDYIDDTEDYITIMLDEKQNNLLRLGVTLATAIFMISVFMIVVDTFGININIEMFDDKKSRMPEFLWTIAGGTLGTVFLYIAAIAWLKHKHLLY